VLSFGYFTKKSNSSYNHSHRFSKSFLSFKNQLGKGVWKTQAIVIVGGDCKKGKSNELQETGKVKYKNN